MSVEYWMLAIAGMVAALLLGFLAGRRSAPAQQRLKALEKERDEARAEVERVQAEVASHFEQSARMFGRLADDYRSFFEHFARTAQGLGLSEGRARELLQRADPRLVADQSATAAGGHGANASPSPAATESAAAAASGAADSGHDPVAAGSGQEPEANERQGPGVRDRPD